MYHDRDTLVFFGRPGRGGCRSALWDCFGGQISLHVENASPKTVPQGTRQPTRPGPSCNLKVTNIKTPG